MALLVIENYFPEQAREWDAFVEKSWNGTFLHTRRYLSYHGDRFHDESVIIHSQDGKWLGILASAQDPSDPTTVMSHPGITFGGLIHGPELASPEIHPALEAACAHYAARGYKRLRYKTVPHIYHRVLCEEDRYALTKLKATLYRGDLWSVVNLAEPNPVTAKTRRKINKASHASLTLCRDTEQLPLVWELIHAQLDQRYRGTPVHSLEELQELFHRFPQYLTCWGTYINNYLAAAVITYKFGRVIRFQYSSSTEEGRAVNAPIWLFSQILAESQQLALSWADFGHSQDPSTQAIQDGLYRFKKQFGSHGLVHQFFEVAL